MPGHRTPSRSTIHFTISTDSTSCVAFVRLISRAPGSTSTRRSPSCPLRASCASLIVSGHAEFSHDNELPCPAYYRVYLDTHDATIEVTPTKRSASFRVTYGEEAPAYLVVDGFPGGSSIKILPDEQKIIGISRYNHGGVPKGFASYFVIEFDRPFKSWGTWTPNDIAKGSEAARG